jgi:outer membrane lipoprotein carrier protein
MTRSLLWGLLTALFVAAPLQAQNPATIAGRASLLYRGLASLRADFHQVIEDQMIGTQESRGELVQAGEARLSMRFSDPKGDMIVLDGTHVWVYVPSTTPGQVIRMNLQHDPVYGPNVLARILDRPAERYQLEWVATETIGNLVTDAVAFTPNVADPLFRKATIWFDREQGLPRRLQLDELTGVRRTLDLSRIRLNTPIDDRTFRFDVPSGVRVVIQ